MRFCRDVLPQNAQAFNDSRLELIIDCAKKQLLQAETKFDIIIMDLDDPLEGGPCYQVSFAACVASALIHAKVVQFMRMGTCTSKAYTGMHD